MNKRRKDKWVKHCLLLIGYYKLLINGYIILKEIRQKKIKEKITI